MTEWMVASLSVKRSVSGHCVGRALSFILFRSFFRAIFPVIRVLASSVLGIDWGKEIFYLVLLFSVRYSVIFCAWVLRCRALWNNFFGGKIPGVSWEVKRESPGYVCQGSWGRGTWLPFQIPSMYLEFWAFINFVFNITYLIKIYVILNNEQF